MDRINRDKDEHQSRYPHPRRIRSDHWRHGVYRAKDLFDVALNVGRFVGGAHNENNREERWLEAAQKLAAFCRQRSGRHCEKCRGEGVLNYGHTSGWRGGVGVSSPTYDLCDTCWGTGRSDLVGEDLRAQRERVKQLEAQASLRWFVEKVGGGWVDVKYLKAITEKISRMRWHTADEEWTANRTMDAVVDALKEVIASKEAEE